MYRKRTTAHLKNLYRSNKPEFGSGMVPFVVPLPSCSGTSPMAAARGEAGSTSWRLERREGEGEEVRRTRWGAEEEPRWDAMMEPSGRFCQSRRARGKEK